MQSKVLVAVDIAAILPSFILLLEMRCCCLVLHTHPYKPFTFWGKLYTPLAQYVSDSEVGVLTGAYRNQHSPTSCP